MHTTSKEQGGDLLQGLFCVCDFKNTEFPLCNRIFSLLIMCSIWRADVKVVSLFFFFFLITLCGFRDLSSLTRD